MNIAAMQAMQQCRAMLKMDSSPLRFEWITKGIEADFVTMRRRREMLAAAGCHWSNQYRAWDDLPEGVREALNRAHLA